MRQTVVSERTQINEAQLFHVDDDTVEVVDGRLKRERVEVAERLVFVIISLEALANGLELNCESFGKKGTN